MKTICEYCESKFEGRRNKLFCSDNCRKYHNKWTKREIRTPYSINRTLSEDETILKERAEKLNTGLGNSTAQLVLDAIELDHFKVISNSDIRYLGFSKKKGT